MGKDLQLSAGLETSCSREFANYFSLFAVKGTHHYIECFSRRTTSSLLHSIFLFSSLPLHQTKKQVRHFLSEAVPGFSLLSSPSGNSRQWALYESNLAPSKFTKLSGCIQYTHLARWVCIWTHKPTFTMLGMSLKRLFLNTSSPWMKRCSSEPSSMGLSHRK